MASLFKKSPKNELDELKAAYSKRQFLYRGDYHKVDEIFHVLAAFVSSRGSLPDYWIIELEKLCETDRIRDGHIWSSLRWILFKLALKNKQVQVFLIKLYVILLKKGDPYYYPRYDLMSYVSCKFIKVKIDGLSMFDWLSKAYFNEPNADTRAKMLDTLYLIAAFGGSGMMKKFEKFADTLEKWELQRGLSGNLALVHLRNFRRWGLQTSALPFMTRVKERLAAISNEDKRIFSMNRLKEIHERLGSA